MVAFTTNKTVAIVALPDARNRPRPILPLTASLPPCEKKPLWTRAPTEGHGGRRDACEVRPGRRRRAAIHADVLRVPGPLARRPRRARPRAPRPTRRGAAARAPRPRHARPPAAERGDHGGLARATRSRRAQEARDRDLGPVLDHLDVHQRAEPGARGRARRGRPGRRRRLRRPPAHRHGAGDREPPRRGQPRARLRGPRTRPELPDRAGRAPVLHAPRARAPPRRARRHGRRPAGERRDPRHRAHALLRGTGAGRPRTGHLLLPPEARARARGAVVPGPLRPLARAPPRPPERDDPRGRARGIASVRDRKSTRLNSSHLVISYAVFCLKKKKDTNTRVSFRQTILLCNTCI